jgi:hypothetical protein
VLPFFAILLFALVGIGALVIDGGLALTEQARLETAAEMMASESAYISSLPDAQLPEGCITDGVRQAACLEAFYFAPILSTLGADLERSVSGEANLLRVDRALDGAAIDSRGVRFGALEVSLEDVPGNIRLARSSPLLFGRATIPAQTRGGSVPDFGRVQAARAAEGLTPDLEGSGLRANGFSLRAEAFIASDGGAPAMRVGPPLDFRGGSTGGLVGIAWLLSDLRPSGGFESRWILGLESPGHPTTQLELVAGQLETSDGLVVACLFSPSGDGAHLGQTIGGSSSGSLPVNEWESAYVPIIRAPDCNTPSPILGFLELGIDAATTPDAVVLRQSAPARRNASIVPANRREAAEAADVWNDPELASSRVWRGAGQAGGLDLALRVPRVVSHAYAGRSQEEGFGQ